jgi:uncharacterized protein YegP (UPF0339 family)
MTMGTFELYRDRQQAYRWRLRAGNNRIIADSGEGYARRTDCEHGIDLVRRMAENVEIYQDRQGAFRWRLRASNGRIVADSGEGYARRSGCARAVDVVRRVAPTARIKDRGSANVLSPSIKEPTAAFTVEHDDRAEPLEYRFDGSAPGDADATIVAFAWDFGDGTAAAGSIAEHVYAVSGCYPVTLTITDDQGLAQTVTQAIIVGAPSDADLALILA